MQALTEFQMTSFGRKSITHLGTLHGEGTLLTQEGRRLGYVDGRGKSTSGQIEAEGLILDEAFRAEEATIVLDTGRCIHIVVSDPQGEEAAEVWVKGGFPLLSASPRRRSVTRMEDGH